MSDGAPKSTPIPVGSYLNVRDGLRLHFHELGTPSPTMPTLLFLHGSGPGASGYSNFHRNFPYFAEQGYHVLVPDYLGYGLSDKPDSIAYTSDLHVEVLAELLSARGVTSVIPIGNSLGGAIAMQYALRHPAQVKRLVMMGPGGLEDAALWAPSMPGLRAMGAFLFGPRDDRAAFRKLLEQLVADPGIITDEVIDSRFPIWLTQPIEVFKTMQVAVSGDRLEELKIPILGLWGQRDRFCPSRHAGILIERGVDVRVVVSSHSGHWFMLEEPAYFNREVLDFLQWS